MYSIIAAKIRLSEQKTKFYLSFLEREYLRAKLKDRCHRVYLEQTLVHLNTVLNSDDCQARYRKKEE